MIPSKYKRLKLCIALSVLAGVSMGPWGDALAAGNQIVSNTQLPQNGTFVGGDGTITPNGKQPHTLDIIQKDTNAVIKWDGGFNVGANGTVEFKRDGGGKFNTLNYDASGQLSQIYGKINAPGGNIYIVNPSGVTIGNSAQINVGSLYVSNQTIDDEGLKSAQTNIEKYLLNTNKTHNSAELMSLGHINAPKVTFKGERVVIDMDRLANTSKENEGKVQLNVTGYPSSEDKNVTYPDIVLGQTTGEKYENINTTLIEAKDDGSSRDITENKDYYNYYWIKNATDLQNINQDLSKHYALRNGIDLTGVENFKPIGDATNPFTGKLDGLSFNIFGLNINRTETDTYTGLFGKTQGAVVRSST